MAIRNAKLGGTDYVNGEVLYDYDLDDTNNTIINNQGITLAELSVRALQAGSFTNTQNLICDNFADENGTLNTITDVWDEANESSGIISANINPDTGFNYTENNPIFRTSLSGYVLGFDDEASGDTTDDFGFTNPANAFDKSSSTYAEKNMGTGANTSYIGKTFASARTIKWVVVNSVLTDTGAGTITGAVIKLQSYNGSTWSDEVTLISTDSRSVYGKITYFLDKSVQGIRVYFSQTSVTNGNGIAKVSQLMYGDYSSSSVLTADANTASLDGNELGFAISSPDATLPTNTSLSGSISDGTTTLTSTAIDSVSKGVVIGNSAGFGGPLSTGTAEVLITLSTTDNTATPVVKNYGVKVFR